MQSSERIVSTGSSWARASRKVLDGLGVRGLVAIWVTVALAACGGGGKGDAGGGSSTTTNQAPTQVMLVEASSVNAGVISASWLTAVDDSTAAGSLRYQLHASTDLAFTPSASTKVFEGQGLTSAIVNGLKSGQTYAVRLVAFDDQGANTVSAPIHVAVSSTVPALQSGVVAQYLTAAQVVSTTSSTVVMAGAASAPAVGGFISSSEANSGQGFLRRVVSVSRANGVTTVQTTPAALNEVFSDLEISSNVTMDTVPTSAASAAVGRGQARVLSLSAAGNPTQYEYRWAQTGLRYSAGIGANQPSPAGREHTSAATVGVKVAAAGPVGTIETATKAFSGSAGFKLTDTIALQFAPEIEFRAKLRLLRPIYSRFVVRAAPRLDQTLMIDAKGVGSLDDTQPVITPRKFTKIIETPAGIPVVVSGIFRLDMRVQGSVTGVLQASEKLSVGFDEISAGLEYQNGAFAPIKSVSPVYSVKMGGNGKASANLQISLLPSLELTGYEVLMGKVVLEPYLAADAGIEGFVQMDAAIDFDAQQPTLPVDADYRLTAARLTAGVNAWLYADMHILDKVLLSYPSGAKTDDYTTFHQEELLANTAIASLPELAVSLPNGVGDGQAIQVRATVKETPNPLYGVFSGQPNSYIPWQKWTRPRLIPPVGVTYGYEVTGSDGSYVVKLTEPGTYKLRVGGNGIWGGWARQYVEVTIATGFTKVSAEGKDLPSDATNWSCVRHNKTGLLWEAHVRRQTPVSPCPFNARLSCTGYTNYGDGRINDASTVPLTVGQLCGKMGWRLPTKNEGRALVEDTLYRMDVWSRQKWFGADDRAYGGWTSTEVESQPYMAWTINFGPLPLNVGVDGGAFSRLRSDNGYYFGDIFYDQGLDYMNVRLVAGP